MRKVVFLILALVALSIFAVPAFAQGGETAASGGTNWVAITSGFAMAFAAALAALGSGSRGFRCVRGIGS
jgi:hypothetical protein